MFAVMTRLEEPKRQNVDIVKKMKLYDGEDVEGYKSKDVRELKEETIREGMDGSRRATSSIVSRARWSAMVSPVSIPSTRCVPSKTVSNSTRASAANSATLSEPHLAGTQGV